MIDEAALVLANCLDALDRRELTLDEYAARHPDQYRVLTELVPVAQRLQAAPDVRPSPDFRADARQRLMARLPARVASRPAPRSRWSWPQRAGLLRALAVLLIVIVLGSSVVAASAQSLPNEVLYPVKITVEQVRLALSPDQLTRSELNLGFASERLSEVQRLIDRGQGSETAGTLDAFAEQFQSAAQLAHGLPTSAGREAMLAHLHSSIDRLDEELIKSEGQLPTSVRPAVQRARAALRSVPPQDTPETPPPTSTPTLTPTPTSTIRPPALPTRLPPVTATPQPGVLPTLRPTHATLTTPVTATLHRPTHLPTRWPTPAVTRRPTFVPPTLPTWPPKATPGWPPTLPTHPPFATPGWPPTSSTHPPFATPGWPPILPTRSPNATIVPGSMPPPWPPLVTKVWPTPRR